MFPASLGCRVARCLLRPPVFPICQDVGSGCSAGGGFLEDSDCCLVGLLGAAVPTSNAILDFANPHSGFG